ncbi:MAG: DUF4670 domain-containing protein [Spirochaetaceae bacterium]|jgi:DNA repair exonuclease SbcCD ATPase subunit|nr:DUF4670 domain-containing protein [Spirochaetaceae bacterium]
MAEPIMGLTFEHVWAALQENARQQQETDRRLKELAEEADRRNKELAEQADQRNQELREETDRWNKELREETNRWNQELREETDRRFKELAEEADRWNKELREETDRRLKELAEQADLRHKELSEEQKRLAEQADLRQQETDRRFNELAEQADLRHKEMVEEADRRNKELGEKIEDGYKKMRKALGEWDNKMGKLVEHIIKAGLVENFNGLGYAFTQIGQRVDYARENGEIGAEVDIQLEDKDTVIAVEAKATLTVKDIKAHNARMAFLREWADRLGDARRYQGALAGMIISKQARDYTLKSGFFLIELSGKTTAVTKPPVVKSW